MRSGLVTTNVLACIFKLNFQRVIGFIAKEFGDLERSPISQEVMPFFFIPSTNFRFLTFLVYTLDSRIVLGDDRYSGSSCIKYRINRVKAPVTTRSPCYDR